jgi:thiamine biosynthesis lipoprotein
VRVSRTVPHAPRTVHVEHCMGTVFSIDIRDGGEWSSALADLVGRLHRVDAMFSTYRKDSAVSRLRRGELRLADCPPEVAHVLQASADLTAETGGYFTAYPAGQLDPSGYVKGWAIESASEMLREYGSTNHAVNGGGDVQCAGESAPGRPWRIGLTHPLEPGQLTAVVELRDGAVATSGTSERGAHVINPRTGLPATDLASVSVIGDRITQVDAYATAGLAMGRYAFDWFEQVLGFEAVIVDAAGRARRTTGLVAAGANAA